MRYRFFLVVLCLVAAGCDRSPVLKMGWSIEEPAAEMSQTLAGILAEEFTVETTQFRNHDELHEALTAGAINLAVIEQPERPNPDLAAITHLFPSVLHLLVRDCPPTQNLHELLEKNTIYPGPVGSTGHRLLTELASAQLIAPLSSMQILASPFGAQPDVLMVFGGILSSDALSRLEGYCLASLSDPAALGQGAWVEGIAYRFPHIRPFVIPAGLYPPLNDKPVQALAVSSLLVTRSSLPERSAYRIAALVKQHAPELEEIYPLAGDHSNNERLAALSNLPMHPGAERFSNRDAPTILERYAELLAFILTLIVALTSAAVAIVRMRRQAKKDRLDGYFDKLLAIRKTLAEDPMTSNARDTIMELQAKVTNLVVDERVAADASLVAFYALSNQILQEANDSKS